MIIKKQELIWNLSKTISLRPERAYCAAFITYGKWYGVLLSAENKKQFFIPKNFAHGFIVLSDYAEFAYKCTDFYHPNDEGGLFWADPKIGVEWPMPDGMTREDLIISEKDQKWGGIQEYTENREL